MSGLMTRMWPRPAPLTRATSIAPSLLTVVENVLSAAWWVLLDEVNAGRFSICKAKEDEITEQLHLILGEFHAADQEVVPGLSSFETSVREGNLRSYDGKHLDRQPDLTFRPLRGAITTTNTALTGIFIECKPIDSEHPVPSTYCKEGLIRFIRGDYAWAVDHALMVGYVRNDCSLPDGLAPCIDVDLIGQEYRSQGSLITLAPTILGDVVYQSTHERDFPLASPHETAGPITLHHLWLHPTTPCETSKCRGRNK